MSRSNHGKGHLTFSSLYLAAVLAFVGDGVDTTEQEAADELTDADRAYLHMQGVARM